MRPTCARCGRPTSVCYCAHLVELETRTRVVFLQHPREAENPIGTAKMASLCLPGSEIHVGVRWSEETLAAVLADARPAALLYPGEGARDVAADPPPGPITLVVIDGTWAHARSIVKKSPALLALPRYSFSAERPSEYRIRKEPRLDYLSTIESLAHVLGVLEGEPERFTQLYRPFRAMVETQLEHARRSSGGRHKKKIGPRPRPRTLVPLIFDERKDDLVCIVAEVNAWAVGSEHRRAGHDPGEIVHCVAMRVTTGEALDLVVAPRAPLSKSTAIHTELSEETLRSAVPQDEMVARLRDFVRASDVLVAWGTHTPNALRGAGVVMPKEVLDLRRIARIRASKRVGPIEGYAQGLGIERSAPTLTGRAGKRLALALDVTRHFGREAVDSPPAPR